MVTSLDAEIEILDKETNEKLQKLRQEQRFKSMSGYGSQSSRHDTQLETALFNINGQAPDMDEFHTSLQFTAGSSPRQTRDSLQTTDGGEYQTAGEEYKTPCAYDENNDDQYGGNPSTNIYDSA